MRKSSAAAKGPVSLLKNCGPTEILVPRTASESTGNIVPQNTITRIAMKTQLLSTKLASRETTDSSRLVLRRLARRQKSSAK